MIMLWFQPTLLVLLLGYGAAAPSSPVVSNQQWNTNDYVINTLVENLASFPDLLLYYLDDILSPQRLANVENVFKEADPYSPATCAACMAVMELVNSLLDEGLDYEDSRDQIIDFCLAALNGTDTRGDIICEGLMDNYAPHLFYILDTKPASSAEFCLFMHHCQEQDNVTMTTERREDAGDTLRHIREVRHSRTGTGIKRDLRENILRIVHITDIHVEEAYLEGTATDCGLPVCCREDSDGEGSAGLWGAYSCNVPPRTTEGFLKFFDDMSPPADFLIYTGDSPPHTSWEETQQGQLNVSRWVGEAIGRILPETDAYSCIGNHEIFPSNLYYMGNPDMQELNQVFTDIWDPLSKFSDENKETLAIAGYYALHARPGLRILAYNSNYGYVHNWYNWINIDREEYQLQKDFMLQTLEEARENEEKVILVGHHPTGDDDSQIYWGHFMIDLVNEYSDVIVIHIMGHTHEDEFKIVIDPEDGLATGVQYIAGTANSQTNVNPNARIYYLDKVTYELIDYEHFYLDIESVMKNPFQEEAPIALSYVASAEYDLEDLSPLSWQELTYRFENDTDLFDKYWLNMRGKSLQTGSCGPVCRTEEICKMRSSSLDLYRECVDSL